MAVAPWDQAKPLCLVMTVLYVIHRFSKAAFRGRLQFVPQTHMGVSAGSPKDYELINTGQYGSVPGKTAIELVMLNQISNDTCQTNKINLIRFRE